MEIARVEMTRLGILGGTFDPPHIGHLILAQNAFENFKLDKVLFVPAAIQPHKQKRKVGIIEDLNFLPFLVF